MPWAAIQASVSGSGQYPRNPICRKRSPRAAPESIRRRIGVPCPIKDPNWVFPVSAWASKWITDTRPHPTWRATPVTSGQATVWSPPRITGTAPEDGHRQHGGLQAGHGRLDLARGHLHVPDVDDTQLYERVDAQRQMGPAAVVRQVIGQPHGLRAKTRSRSVRRAAVIGGAQDHGSGPGEGCRLVQGRGRHPEERGVGSEHVAQARHRHPPLLLGGGHE